MAQYIGLTKIDVKKQKNILTLYETKTSIRITNINWLSVTSPTIKQLWWKLLARMDRAASIAARNSRRIVVTAFCQSRCF
jgi:hypothetical protein